MHRHKSAISQMLPQTKGWLNLFLGVQKRNEQEHDDHIMTQAP